MNKFCVATLAFLVLLAAPLSAARDIPAWETRMAELARLWGLLKYHHPYLDKLSLDWDAALTETIPLLEKATDRKSYQAAITHLLTQIGDPATRVIEPRPVIEPEINPANKLPQPFTKWIDQHTALLVMTDYTAIAAGVFDSGPTGLQNALHKCADAETIIFDLRRQPGGRPDTPDDIDQWCLAWALNGALPMLLEQDVLLATIRYRFHSGYRPNFNQHRNLYASGFMVEEFPILKSHRNGKKAPTLVFLTNNESKSVFRILSGLQSAELAWVIHQTPSPTLTSPSHDIHLAGDITVRMRTGQLINPDSSVGFIPDLLVQKDEALAIGLAIARGKLKPKRPERKTVELEPAIQKLEDPRQLTPYPSREERLLGLFRLWTVIDLFYPYTHLLDKPWNRICRDFLCAFANAPDARSYHLAVAKLVACLHDSHTFIQSPELDQFFGTLQPTLRIRYIDNQPVVTFVHESEKDVQPGDVILTVDGESMATRRKRLEPYLGASTPQAMDSRMAKVILAGRPGKPSRFTWLKRKGKQCDGLLPRFLSWDQLRHLERMGKKIPTWSRLEKDIGYLDLTRLKRDELVQALEKLFTTKSMIVDLRGYPRGTAWLLAPRLAKPCSKAAMVFKPFQSRPHMEVLKPTFSFEQCVLEVGKRRYQGSLAVLINEETMSQGEHTCLFLEKTASRISFVGSPTNGTNGDITNITLPGGIYLHFSGQGVRHADGSQLQRRGIQPDIHVRPTISEIKQGKDRVLERALEHLRTQLKSKAVEKEK